MPKTSHVLSRNHDHKECLIMAPGLYIVLRKLMRVHDVKPSLDQAIIELLATGIYPSISKLLPIAKYFKITVDQLTGGRPLKNNKKTKSVNEPGTWNEALYLECAKYAMSLFKRYKINHKTRFARHLIADVYHYSLNTKNSTLNKGFAEWYISQFGNQSDNVIHTLDKEHIEALARRPFYSEPRTINKRTSRRGSCNANR